MTSLRHLDIIAVIIHFKYSPTQYKIYLEDKIFHILNYMIYKNFNCFCDLGAVVKRLALQSEKPIEQSSGRKQQF